MRKEDVIAEVIQVIPLWLTALDTEEARLKAQVAELQAQNEQSESDGINPLTWLDKPRQTSEEAQAPVQMPAEPKAKPSTPTPVATSVSAVNIPAEAEKEWWQEPPPADGNDDGVDYSQKAPWEGEG